MNCAWCAHRIAQDGAGRWLDRTATPECLQNPSGEHEPVAQALSGSLHIDMALYVLAIHHEDHMHVVSDTDLDLSDAVAVLRQLADDWEAKDIARHAMLN
jgi:hypothetical protein